MLDNNKNSLPKRTTLTLMLLTIVTKLIGFSREIIISYYYGASNISDAYLIALSIPGSLFLTIGLGITTAYIPMYSNIEREKGKKAAHKFTNNFINSIVIATSFLVLIIFLFTDKLVKAFAFGFDKESLRLATEFTRISMLGILFTGIVYVYTGYLNVKNNFLIPALMSFPFNISIILSIVLSHKYNPMLLPVGSVMAEVLQFLFLFPFIYKDGFRHKPVVDLKDSDLRKMIGLAFPVMLGVSVNQINVLVDKTIASQVAVGGISALNYASRLNSIVQGIFTASVITVLFPMISRLMAENNKQGFKSAILKAANVILLIVLPSSVGFMIFSKEIVVFLFGRGAFDQDAILLTSSALFFYSIGMIGTGIRDVLSKAFYAMQDTKTPMTNAMIGVGLNIVLTILLSKVLGIGGLALATSIVSIFISTLMFLSLRRKIGALGFRKIAFTFCKIMLASLVMAVIARLLYGFVLSYTGSTLALICSMLVGASSYFILIYLMKVEEITMLINILRQRRVTLITKKRRIWKDTVLIGRNKRSRGKEDINKSIDINETLNNNKAMDNNKVMDKSKSMDKTSSGDKGEVIQEELCLKESIIRTLPARRSRDSIGIVIVTYQNTEHLKQTIKFIYNQTHNHYFLFIIDNDGPETNREFIDDLVKRDHNINYYRLNTDTGRAGGFYYGLKMAFESGLPYLWCLEAGDCPHKNALLELLHMTKELEPRTCLISRKTERFDQFELRRIQYSENMLTEAKSIHFNGFYLSRNLIEQIGLPRKELYQSYDDYDYYKKIVNQGYLIYQVRDSMLSYQEIKKEYAYFRLWGKTHEIQLLTKDQWYYYMRNGLLVHPKGEMDDKEFRRRHLHLLFGVMLVQRSSFRAALSGYLDGLHGKSGKNEKFDKKMN